jgi:hypothetical protein
MKKTLTSAFLALLFLSFAKAQTTDSLTGPQVWLNAERSPLSGNQWSDLSFHKNHAVGLTPASTPSAYGTVNFNKTLIFDGVDDYLKIPYSLDGLSELAIIAVFQSNDTTERGVWGTEQAITHNISLTTRRAFGPDTTNDFYGRSEKLLVLNSVVQNWDKTSTLSSSSFMSLGSAGTTKTYKPFQGSIAELIVFNRALTFLERVKYETYLAIKYGTGLRGGNFVSSKEELLWHVEQNAGYGRNIAGLGRDDFFKLYQKQSGSAYDTGLLIISSGDLSISNQNNPSSIADQDFILWGDNGLSLNTKPGAGRDSVLSFVQRKWLVTANGNSANTIATNLYIDVSRFPAEPLGYWLVIDRSGTGNFSVDNLEYILPDRIENGKLVYENVSWDLDRSGKDHFGFARMRELLVVVRTLADPSCTDENAGKVKIEVIAGKPSFIYKLTSNDKSISRSWKQSATHIEQKDLTRGEYTLVVRDGSGETLARNFTLVMPDAIAISLGPDKQFSLTTPIILDVSNQIPDSINVSYRWENSFGFSSDETSITVPETGVYRVFVKNEKDGCVFTDDVAITGAESNRITVYPTVVNSDETFNISVSLEHVASVTVKVFNANGLMLKAMEGNENSEYQFITSLKDSGLYLIVIQSPAGIETRKVIVH